jgi:hypothetical protein
MPTDLEKRVGVGAPQVFVADKMAIFLSIKNNYFFSNFLWVPGSSRLFGQADFGPRPDCSGARVGLGGVDVESWLIFLVALSSWVAAVPVKPAVLVGGRHSCGRGRTSCGDWR